jgi:hypothetical protein
MVNAAAPPCRGAQRRPSLDMGDRVVGVAVGGAELQRNAIIGIANANRNYRRSHSQDL